MISHDPLDARSVPIPLPPGVRLKDVVVEYERRLIRRELERTNWNQQEVAYRFCILPSTLSEKMKRLGLRGSRSGI